MGHWSQSHPTTIGKTKMKTITTPRLLTGAALALLTLMHSGCTSIRARTELPDNDWKVYPGMRRGVADLDNAFTGKLKGQTWSPAVVVPILVADMPLSATLDTVALPYDIYRVTTLPAEPPQP